MLHLLASALASLGMVFGGLFGGHDGPPPMASTTPDMHMHMSSTSPMGMRDRQPPVMGVVTSVNGSTLTITGMQNMKMPPGMVMASTTFTVDATNARVVEKGNTSSAVSTIKVGDHVLVMGTVNGASVVAKTIIDTMMPAPPQNGRGSGGGRSNVPPTMKNY